MAVSQELMSLLGQTGMPDSDWWARATTAYHELCQILTEDINTTDHINSASRPRIKILPAGNFACELSSRTEILPCVAFGNIRGDLFVEVAWQNITSAEDRGVTLKAYEVSATRVVLELSGFAFSLRYVESSELLKLYPHVIDAPRDTQSGFEDEIGETIRIIQDLQLFSDHIMKHPTFQQLYYTMRTMMVSLGLHREEDRYQPSMGSSRRINSIDAELLRELCWRIFSHGSDQEQLQSITATIANYLSLHEKCLLSSGMDECPFYFDPGGPFARSLSRNQFLGIHRRFQELQCHMTAVNDEGLATILEKLRARTLSQKCDQELCVRVTIRYSGNSQLDGTKMIDFVERKFLDLILALENTADDLYLNPWHCRMVDIHATKYDNPYEGYWMINMPMIDDKTRRAVRSVLATWNHRIQADRRYSEPTMFIEVELITRHIMLQKELMDDTREWPRPLAKPDPRYLVSRVVSLPETAESASIDPSQPSRKLRPALDVLSRLKHDPAFDLDDYVVGYTDRHSGIQEKAVGAWVSESTDDEWIPQGRIQYFKRVSDGTRVWDRATKCDLIFR